MCENIKNKLKYVVRYFFYIFEFFSIGGKEEKVPTTNKKNDRRHLSTQKKCTNQLLFI